MGTEGIGAWLGRAWQDPQRTLAFSVSHSGFSHGPSCGCHFTRLTLPSLLRDSGVGWEWQREIKTRGYCSDPGKR